MKSMCSALEAVAKAAKEYFTCLKTPCDSYCKNAHRKNVYHALKVLEMER